MALDHGPTRERAGDTVAPGVDRLGPYRLVSRLGEGGMGVVHLGLDAHGRAVAIKVLRPHVAYDPEARWRLEREVDTLTRIRSDRVAAVIDSDIAGDRPYLVTRFVAGPSLDDVVTDEGPLSPDQLVLLGRGLVEALEAIHAVGVVHRDLKPGNVLLEDGEPVVIDFGIAHIADDVRLTSSGLVMGTPGYLSPEVIGGSPVTQATDWWGWAATLAFAASGRPPFGRGPMDVVLGRVNRGEADLTGVNGRLSPLLAAALSPDPALRPPTGAVVAALERYASGGPAAAPANAWDQDDYPRASQPWPAPETGPDAYGLAPAPRRPGSTSPLPTDDDDLIPWEEGDDPDQSDWEAAWEADPDEPDPRINRANRAGTLLALATAFTATAATWPGIALLLAVLWCWLARFSDRSVTALILRRYRKGPRRADVPMAVALSPWHLVVAAGATVAGLVVPVVVAVSAAFCSALGLSALTTTTIGPALAPAAAVGFAAGILLAWWGPGGASLRRGSRSLVRGVARGETVTKVLVAALLVVTAALVVVALVRHGQLTWWPFPWPT
jgi:serine/threonine protein kinase